MLEMHNNFEKGAAMVPFLLQYGCAAHLQFGVR